MIRYVIGKEGWSVEERKLIQLITEKRRSMHSLYIQANKNLRDEKVLAASKEVDRLINTIMKQRMAARSKVHC
ncbi:Spo0E like sporulation regulatory protein [Aneurinibacillus aneurinilyticus ATCC 12856]|uniref:Spo0E like sporulation regulatory protein n=1 Tax=Aneurinibacillus aneurinilyticus ATCC 12856 TaxID=649747 RepID=U1YC29_ANEAE|nr:aspartyl-phosphate phosphatase Spo0E family protein [Aneurinibacillus aneurinilyticus]ERI08346.1 Spo0E like sporulation regulatory protein [Aneurinibacillus aneurinilyticus ATCC 12856]